MGELKLQIGDVYTPKGNGLLHKDQVVVGIEDEKNFTKQAVWIDNGKLIVGLEGGGNIDEVGKVYKKMTIDEICRGWRNFLKRGYGSQQEIEDAVMSLRERLKAET